MPSFGCDRDAVDYIVRELNERVRYRGDAAQIQLGERVGTRTNEVNEKMEIITNYLISQAVEIPAIPSSLFIDER